MDPSASPVHVDAWRPPVAGIREVLHARFQAHAYPRHAHDTWTLFIVDAGAVRYDLGRHERVAAPSMVSALPPHVAHDGRPAIDGGYGMRVLYLETSVLPESLVGPAVDRPFIDDWSLRRRVEAVHEALLEPDGALEAETRLHLVTERIGQLLGAAGGVGELVGLPGRRSRDLGEAVRAALDAALVETPSFAALAASLGASPTAAARAFRSTFGLPPHEYVLGRRLEAARARILDGMPLADVAAATGFADQAHLTRRFRRLAGTTPGRYARRGAS
jgi:AraC-like DNA-binding protein